MPLFSLLPNALNLSSLSWIGTCYRPLGEAASRLLTYLATATPWQVVIASLLSFCTTVVCLQSVLENHTLIMHEETGKAALTNSLPRREMIHQDRLMEHIWVNRPVISSLQQHPPLYPPQ